MCGGHKVTLQFCLSDRSPQVFFSLPLPLHCSLPPLPRPYVPHTCTCIHVPCGMLTLDWERRGEISVSGPVADLESGPDPQVFTHSRCLFEAFARRLRWTADRSSARQQTHERRWHHTSGANQPQTAHVEQAAPATARNLRSAGVKGASRTVHRIEQVCVRKSSAHITD